MTDLFDPRDLFTGRDELRNFAVNSIYPAYDPDVSANQIITNMRDLGMGYRRQDMLADIRFARGLVKNEQAMREYPGAGLVPKNYMEDVPYSLSQKAQYRFEIIAFDEETGELVSLGRSLATNNWYTKEEAEEFMAGFMSGVLQEYGLRMIGLDLLSMWTKDKDKMTR